MFIIASAAPAVGWLPGSREGQGSETWKVYSCCVTLNQSLPSLFPLSSKLKYEKVVRPLSFSSKPLLPNHPDLTHLHMGFGELVPPKNLLY